MSVTPFLAHSSCSAGLILREELATSILSSPTPAQNCFRPADEPPDSITGVLRLEKVLPNCSATMLAYGRTVDDPATLTWSRAKAAQANAPIPTTVAVVMAMNLLFTLNLHCLVECSGAALR